MIGFGKRPDRGAREERIEGEREVSAAAEGRRSLSRQQAAALFVLGGGALVAFVFHRDAQKKPPEPKPPMGQIGMVLAGPPPPVQASPTPAPLAVLATPPPPSNPGPSLATALPSRGGAPGTESPKRRVYSYGSMQTAQVPPAVPPGASPDSPGGSPELGHTSVAFKASRVPGVRAGAAMDLTYVLLPTVVKCVTAIAIDTTQPGAILCHTTETLRSRFGVALMEVGTTITGTYAGVQQGQGRFPAVAATAITPNGVPVELGAPMTDALGRSGVDGDVDNHLGARFGGALMLLASQGAIQIAQSALQAQSRAGGSYTNLNLGTLDSAVSEVLRNTVNIPPTISVPQGREIAFLVTKPIDFSDAYELRMAR